MSESSLQAVPTRSEVLSRSISGRNFGLDLLRIISICGVVAIHIFGYMVTRATQGSWSWWVAVAADIGFVWVVPVFVMISGALLLGSKKVAEAPKEFYRSRALRLIPALIVWNLVYLVGVRLLLRGERLDISRVLQLIFDGSVFTQLYFLWLIVGLYAIAPILASFIRAGSRYRALTTGTVILAVTLLAYILPGILAVFGLARPISLNFMTYSLPYVGYFVMGYALRQVRLTGVKLFGVAVLTVLLIALVIWQYGNGDQFRLLNILAPVSYLGVIVAVLAVCIFVLGLSLFKGVRLKGIVASVVRKLSEASFGVFLIHLLIFEMIRLNVPIVAAGTSLGVTALVYLVVVLASFLISAFALKIPLLRTVF